MAQAPKATILDHFAELDDPRVERTRHHKLPGHRHLRHHLWG